jgi:hypothetical protein
MELGTLIDLPLAARRTYHPEEWHGEACQGRNCHLAEHSHFHPLDLEDIWDPRCHRMPEEFPGGSLLWLRRSFAAEDMLHSEEERLAAVHRLLDCNLAAQDMDPAVGGN